MEKLSSKKTVANVIYEYKFEKSELCNTIYDWIYLVSQCESLNVKAVMYDKIHDMNAIIGVPGVLGEEQPKHIEAKSVQSTKIIKDAYLNYLIDFVTLIANCEDIPIIIGVDLKMQHIFVTIQRYGSDAYFEIEKVLMLTKQMG